MSRPAAVRGGLAAGALVALTGSVLLPGAAQAAVSHAESGGKVTLTADGAVGETEMFVTREGGEPVVVDSREALQERPLKYAFFTDCREVSGPLCPVAGTAVPPGEYTVDSNGPGSEPVTFTIAPQPSASPSAGGGQEGTAGTPSPTPSATQDPASPTPTQSPGPMTGSGRAPSLGGSLGDFSAPGPAPVPAPRGPDIAPPPALQGGPVGGEFAPLLEFPAGSEPLVADDEMEPGEPDAVLPARSVLATTEQASLASAITGAVDLPQVVRSVALMAVLLLAAAHLRRWLRTPAAPDA